MVAEPADLGDGIFRALLATYRKALRDRRAEVDAVDVLIESVSPVTANVAGLPAKIAERLAGAFSGIHAPEGAAASNGHYGVERPGLEVDGMLREVAWRGVRYTSRRLRRDRNDTSPPMWSESVRSALDASLAEASRAGVAHASGTRLALGLLADNQGSAVTLVQRAKLDRDQLVRELRDSGGFTRSAQPRAPVVSLLDTLGALNRTGPRLLDVLTWLPRRSVVKRSGRTVVAFGLGDEVVRQSVRRAGPTVSTAHVIAAMLSLQWQLRVTQRSLNVTSRTFDVVNDALDAGKLPLSARDAAVPPDSEQDQLSESESRKRLLVTAGPPWSRRAARAFDRASAIARQRGHPQSGLAHLLLAVVEDHDNAGVPFIRSAGADPEAIRDHLDRSLTSVR